MKVFLLVLAIAVAASAVPQGRRLRPEEQWHPSGARDLSKYRPRYPVVPNRTPDQSWEQHMARINKKAKELRKKLASGQEEGAKVKDVECGIEGPPAAGRIVGGIEAEENQWPWQVALFIDDAWFCGGSIINEKWVLTAAHCADDAMYFDIMAGAHNVRESSEPHRVEITSYNGFTHPNWNPSDLSGDLALIELPSPIEFNDYIKPACLPEGGDALVEGDLVTVTGWGKPSDSAGGISPVLRMVSDLPVISNEACNDVYGIVGPGVVCVDTTGGKSSCNGDSGGPLIQRFGEKASGPGQKWNQVGIVSFGSSSGCEVEYPAGFTRTEFYLDWIKSNTGM